MSELAVQGCTVAITSGQSASTIQITTSPFSDNLVNNKGIYFGNIDVKLVAIVSGNFACAEGTITISGTASNILDSNGNKAVQKNDSGTALFTFTHTSSGAKKQISVTVQITDAGQTDVTAL